ncbi:MAG: hypothetical protein R3D68_18640 [Hyphomicrobiaceae bacterium]
MFKGILSAGSKGIVATPVLAGGREGDALATKPDAAGRPQTSNAPPMKIQYPRLVLGWDAPACEMIVQALGASMTHRGVLDRDLILVNPYVSNQTAHLQGKVVLLQAVPPWNAHGWLRLRHVERQSGSELVCTSRGSDGKVHEEALSADLVVKVAVGFIRPPANMTAVPLWN